MHGKDSLLLYIYEEWEAIFDEGRTSVKEKKEGNEKDLFSWSKYV